MTDTDAVLSALAPKPEPFDTQWSQATMAAILATEPSPPRRRRRRWAVAGVAAGVVALTAAGAVAAGGPADVVRDAIRSWGGQADTAAYPLGRLDDPRLVAKFRTTTGGVFAFWVATSSTGDICYADTYDTWDGHGHPTEDQLEFGCGAMVSDARSRHAVEMTRPDQLGGYFRFGDPRVWGISPYADAATVHVVGDGVDRTLAVRPDSHGYGTGLPESSRRTTRLTLTFLATDGSVLGTKVLAPLT